MASRTRTRFVPSLGVYQSWVNNVHQSTVTESINKSYDQCSDTTGSPHVDHAFTVKSVDTSDFRPMIGVEGSGIYKGSGYYSDCYGNSVFKAQAHLPLDFGSTNADLTRAIALTNPSRPGVTPLTLIQDLVEIPKQLKDVGKLIRNPKSLLSAREIANQHLAIRFGWLPLISDAKSLFGLQDQIHNRVGELNRLYSETGLHRRIHMGYASAELTTPSYYIGSYTKGTVQTKVKQFTQSQRWASVRWKPTVAPRYNPSDSEQIKMARQLVSGLTVEGMMKGAWDVIPWTWVINWFTNVSDFAMAHSNTVPAIPYSACLMQDTITQSQFEPIYRDSNLSGGEGAIRYETKERFVGGASVSAFLPFIGQDRLSILGSLFVQRFKG